MFNLTINDIKLQWLNFTIAMTNIKTPISNNSLYSTDIAIFPCILTFLLNVNIYLLFFFYSTGFQDMTSNCNKRTRQDSEEREVWKLHTSSHISTRYLIYYYTILLFYRLTLINPISSNPCHLLIGSMIHLFFVIWVILLRYFILKCHPSIKSFSRKDLSRTRRHYFSFLTIYNLKRFLMS